MTKNILIFIFAVAAGVFAWKWSDAEARALQTSSGPTPATTPALPPSEIVQEAVAGEISNDVLLRLLGDPETASVARDCVVATQRQRYAALCAYLGLSAAQNAALTSVLADRATQKLQDAAQTAAGSAAASRAQRDRQFETALRGVVAPSDVALVQLVERRPVTWSKLRRIEDRLRYEATPLSKEQFASLMSLLAGEVQSLPAQLDPGSIAAVVQARKDGDARTARSARSFLADDQYQVLLAQMSEDLTMLQAGLFARIGASAE
jgi:hypothetical protein